MNTILHPGVAVAVLDNRACDSVNVSYATQSHLVRERLQIGNWLELAFCARCGIEMLDILTFFVVAQSNAGVGQDDAHLW